MKCILKQQYPLRETAREEKMGSFKYVFIPADTYGLALGGRLQVALGTAARSAQAWTSCGLLTALSLPIGMRLQVPASRRAGAGV